MRRCLNETREDHQLPGPGGSCQLPGGPGKQVE